MKHSQDSTPLASPTTATDVVNWVQDLMDLHARIAPRFARSETRHRALAFLQGVMSETPRKNGWQLAEQARESTPYGMQRLLATAVWDEERVRDDLRDYVYEHLGAPDAILVIDETSFPKKGEKSAGAQVQYCGTDGDLENCQVAVFLDYVTNRGHTLIDRELYIPKPWIDDPSRCREAGIPETVRFQTKCELARQMVERISNAQIPVSWIVADTVYGNNEELRDWLGVHGYWSVLAVACTERVGIRTPDGRRREMRVREVEDLMIRAQDWQRLSMAHGTKGPRLFDWACVPILHKWEDDGCHWLLIRRCIDDPTTKTYYIVFGPPGTTLQKMVTVIGRRWHIEEDFKTSKALGLDQYEVRQWICWYRHITFVMLAHAFLAIICSKNRNTTIVDASSPNTPSSVTVLDSSPPPPIPHKPPMTPEVSLSVCLPPTPPLVRPLLSSVLPASTPLPSPSMINPAPLTIPEVRHLLARLIWPASTNAQFVLAWSGWRRCHRGMASYYHTKRRLDAP